jgi:bifunctional enzyme CysN/CysC
LLHHLETIPLASGRNLIDVRFPIQWVVRAKGHAHDAYRGYAGQVAGGILRPGDEVIVLPSGVTSTIRSIETFDGPVEAAYPPMSVTITLDHDVDASRGDMIAKPLNRPTVGQDIDAMLCWMSTTPMQVGGKYAIKHTTRAAKAVIKDLRYRINVNSLLRETAPEALDLNEIGRVSIRTTRPLLHDSYGRNRFTGGFILIDEVTNETVAAGMILVESHE